MPIYEAYGLRLRVTRTMFGLVNNLQRLGWDVEVILNEIPRHEQQRQAPQWNVSYTSPVVDDQGIPSFSLARSDDLALIALRYRDGVEFTITANGTAIWANWPQHLSFDYMATYLLGPVLGIVLRLRGIVALHASAVAIDGCAVAFAGSAGAGKSTTAAALAQRGYPVLSDDIVPLADQGDVFVAQPGPPRLQLWADSVNMLYGSPDALPRLIPDWGKRAFDLVTNQRFQQTPLPLGAIYLLDERLPELTTTQIEWMPPREALIALAANTYANKHLNKPLRAAEFEALHALVGRVPIRRVHAPTDPAYLSAFCHAIVEDFRKLSACAAPAVPERSKRV